MRRLRFFVGALLVAAWSPLIAQEGTISGRVIDSTTLQPLQGAVVAVGSRSAITQADGRYVLSGVPAGTETLRVRLLGYAPSTRSVTVAAGQTSTVDLTLTPMALSLAEIVVTGYGAQVAGNITGAVSTVSAEEFNPGRIVSPAQLISAKAPGVLVVDNNEPGGGLTIRIRGSTSWTASSDPLYVIDGMVVGGGAGTGLSAGRDGLNFLNPNDIETITVLRDASAAAIYGANAANGVVLITTRGRSSLRGQTGARWEYTGSFSTSSVDKLPSMLTADQFRTAVETYAPSKLSQLRDENTDWWDYVTQSGSGQEHNLSVSNADANTFYRFSLGYLNQDGIIRGTNVERVTLALNYRQNFFSDRLGIRVNAKGSRSDDGFTPGGVLSNAAQMGPTQPVYDPETVTGYYDWPGGLSSADNPVALVDLARDQGLTYRSVSNLQAEYRLPWIEGLKANVNLGYDIANVTRENYYPSTLHRQVVSTEGSDYRSTPTESGLLLDTYLNYVRPLGPGAFDITAGYSFGKMYGEYPWYSATGLSSDFLEGNGVTPAENTTNGMDVQESKLISFFGRVNYNINDKYLFGASLRRDGSSRFGPDNAWGTFPSVSVGWRLSEEGFLKDGFFSDLKLRVSWAETGNQNFGNYLQYSTYLFSTTNAQVQFGDQFIPTIRPSAVDPNIKWEGTTAYNVGLDFGFSNQRFTGSLDWYTKDTDDMIFQVPTAAGTNFSNYVTTNIGSMRNRGIELLLNAQMTQGTPDKLGWSFGLNASHNQNKLLSINPAAANAVAQQITEVGGIAGGVGSYIQVLRPGYPIRSFFVYQHKLENGLPVYRDTDGDNVITDKDLYVDLNGDGTINVDDRRPYESPDPDWMLGFSNYLSYKRFSLDFTLRAWLGNYVYNNVASNLGTYSELNEGSPYNLHSSVLETGFEQQQLLSDYYVEDGSFLRMDNIQLGYRFDWSGRPLRLFLAMQNAFTITGYSGVDPTAGIGGIDNNLYPRSRTVTGGLTLQF
jgi:TonB-linked SusC/RagA family outer membrane protein